MKEKTIWNDSQNQYFPQLFKAESLTQDEQRRLICGSYCHQYGVLIRLAMFTGIRLNELLGLQWDDVDLCSRRLHIRHTYEVNGDGANIRLSSSPRLIPLLPHVFRDLMDWREERNMRVQSVMPFCGHPDSVAATLTEYQINGEILLRFFRDILQFSGLPDYSFDILRNTFAARALEQGMDMGTLCRVLGDESAISRYAHFAYRNKDDNKALMETLLTAQQPNQFDLTYPVVAKRLENGLTQLRAPNFPELTCSGTVLTDGLIIMREKIEDELHNSCCLPIPVPVSDIPCELGECIIQISVKI